MGHLLVLPFGESSVRRLNARARAGVRNTEKYPEGRHDDACVAYGDHGAVGELGGELLEQVTDSVMECHPTLAARREHAFGLCLHVERTVQRGVVSPFQTVRLAGMDLAQIAPSTESVETQCGRNNLCRLYRPGERAGEQGVGTTNASGRGQVRLQRRRLLAPELRESLAATLSADDSVEPCVGVTVAYQDEPHQEARIQYRCQGAESLLQRSMGSGSGTGDGGFGSGSGSTGIGS